MSVRTYNSFNILWLYNAFGIFPERLFPSRYLCVQQAHILTHMTTRREQGHGNPTYPTWANPYKPAKELV
jgi:hypothetical protein